MKTKSLSPLLASVVTVAGIASTGPVMADVGRGMNVEPQAASCRIGTFPQTSKAGAYNVLCEVMQDSEKCLAFLKRHYRVNGETVTTNKTKDVAKLQYCLEVLQHDLGVGAE